MSTVSFANRPRDIDRDSRPSPCNINVGRSDRLLSVVGAIGFLALSAKRPPLSQVFCLAMSAGLLYRGLTGKCKLYDAIGVDTTYSHSHPNAIVRNKCGVHVIQSMTVQQPVERLYEIWRDFAHLPQYLNHVASVEILDEQRSRWKMKSLAGELQWDAAIIEDKTNEVISWKTIGNADISSAGSVRFTPLPTQNATEMVVNLRYDAVGESMMSWLSSLLGESAESMIREDLRRFKQVLETGEVATISGQSAGR